MGIATGGPARAHDVLVARPDHLEQADVLAERLGRQAPFGWKQFDEAALAAVQVAPAQGKAAGSASARR